MNVTGTIGRPAPHGPRRDTQMTPIPASAPTTGANDLTAAGRLRQEQNRTRKLQLIPEAMARSHMTDLSLEAESQRTARRVALAARMQRRSRRLQRRAERASRRARRALAQAVM
ncbi:hypothetical protein [Streptomyces hoynatensis]|uniref:Uncharacterized protein n=1 Tax=Streptomyces hoynatensis TaxID=1141874 RepID=A0A3A9ZF75_9ACTN|nr:hypothetical protein [Streptomyces hoynatensis]RKN47112.1 hypothetical protein D7294_02755 [Streptomyces hoynatensis]